MKLKLKFNIYWAEKKLLWIEFNFIDSELRILSFIDLNLIEIELNELNWLSWNFEFELKFNWDLTEKKVN